ncbi:hypothetical protein Tco_0948366 [Tanacetum coccineum]
MHAKQEKGKRKSSLFDMPSSESQSAVPRVTPLTTTRPPVTPMVRSNSIEDFNRLSYAMNYHNIRQMDSSSDPNCSPMLSYIPIVNYPYQERVFPVINQERVYPMINQERVYLMINQEHVYPMMNHNTERLAALEPFKSLPLLITNGGKMSSPEFKVDYKTQD